MRGRILLVLTGVLAAVAIAAIGPAGAAGAAGSGDIDYRVTPHWVKAGSNPAAVDDPFCGTLVCYSPNDIKTAYDYPEQLDGSGQTIVIVDAFGSPTIEDDLAFFDAFFGLPAPPSFKVICPLGCPSPSANNKMHDPVGWAVETTLDVEWAHAMAPGANIVLAVSPSSSGNTINNVEKAVVAAYPGSIMSQSFGIPEQFMKSGNNAHVLQSEKIYAAARAAGITALASTGDFGATNGGAGCSTPPAVPKDCGLAANASYPASSPNVTAVGGTQGNPYFNGEDPAASPPPTCALNVDCTVGLATVRCSSLVPLVCPTIGYGGEETWNEPAPTFGVATGGAPSLLFPAPAYQAGIGSGSSARTIPDVSYNAAISGGVLVFLSVPGLDVGFYIVGGTSASSPQMAAVVALANQARANLGRGSLGFLNDRLYGLAKNASTYASDFHDIMIGNNRLVDTPVGFSAGTGYDVATGWGTPKVSNLVADLAAP